MSNVTGESEQQGRTRRRSGSRRAWFWVGGIVLGLVVVWSAAACVLVGALAGRPSQAMPVGSDLVAVIYLEGSIGVATPGSGAAVGSQQIIDYVKAAESNRRVKAIVVYINSPGGAVVPSDLMYQALRDAGKPVVAVMGDVAASGGYYVACGADRILAHPATITGSIGVYGQLVNAAELLSTIGVEGIIVRSGDSKAMGNWFEHPTEEQLAIEQQIVDQLYELFVQAVAEGRSMAPDEVRELADGRAFTGQQALEVGLVDALGSLPDAIDVAANLGGIVGEPGVIEYRRTPSLLELWLSTQGRYDGELAVLQWLDDRFAIPSARYTAP
jgi:protease-4